MSKNILFYYIFGPTGSGKTSLAYKLYRLNPKESIMVSVDSRKLYVGLDIGTHKTPLLDLIKKGVPVLGVNLFAPTKRVSVAMFLKRLLPDLKEHIDKGKTRIIFFGGSGLYMEALLDIKHGLSFVPPDYKLREKLEKLSTKELLDKLISLAPSIKLNKSEANNKVRLIRRLEILLNQGAKITTDSEADQSDPLIKWYRTLQEEATMQFFLFNPFITASMKERFYSRLKRRAFQMVQDGLIQEVKSLITRYGKEKQRDYCPFKEILGYKQVYQFLGKYSSERLSKQRLGELIDTIYVAHRKYAKYQLSFSRRMLKRYNYPTYLFY